MSKSALVALKFLLEAQHHFLAQITFLCVLNLHERVVEVGGGWNDSDARTGQYQHGNGDAQAHPAVRSKKGIATPAGALSNGT
jgi:hypothetical protein